MKNLLITLALLLFSAFALADTTVVLNGLELTRGQVVRVDIGTHISMVRVERDTTELEVEFDGLAAGLWDARITVYEADVRKFTKGEYSLGKVLQTIEAEIEIK